MRGRVGQVYLCVETINISCGGGLYIAYSTGRLKFAVLELDS